MKLQALESVGSERVIVAPPLGGGSTVVAALRTLSSARQIDRG
jgi:hypothetical protein